MSKIEVNNIKEAKIYFMNHDKPANTCVGKWKSESRFLKNLSEALRFYGYGKEGIKEDEEMKLMDYFAAKAMQAIITRENFDLTESSALDIVSCVSYEMAEKMLKRRDL